MAADTETEQRWAQSAFAGRAPGRPAGSKNRKGPQPINHGTYHGWQQHRNQGVALCEFCKNARRAHERTMTKLMKAHVDEYLAIFAEEIKIPRRVVKRRAP